MNPLFNEVSVIGKKYKYGNWQKYAIHDEHSIRGFFGDYRFLSNFEGGPVLRRNGDFSPTVEHAYQLAKEIRLIPSELNPKLTKIQDSSNWVNSLSVQEAKKWGQQVKLRPDWQKVKYQIMAGLVFDKFYRYLELRNKLLQTDNKYLEETNNWHDNIWGNCICPKCKKTVGLNHLGRILTKTRDFWQ